MVSISFCNQERKLIEGLLKDFIEDMAKQAKSSAIEGGKILLREVATSALNKFLKAR